MRWTRETPTRQNLARLKRTWRDCEENQIARYFASGILAPGSALELWGINGASLLATETVGDCIFVWAYEGRDAVSMMEDLIRIARKNEMRVIRYSTDRPGFVRMFNKFRPVRIESDAAENVYEIQVNP